MREPRKGREEESPDFSTKMRPPPPWQPGGNPAVLQQPWVRLGSELGWEWRGAGQAKQRRRAKSPELQWEDVRQVTLDLSGAGGLVENTPQRSSPASHEFIKVRHMGRVFPVLFSDIINNNNHYSSLLSIYSKAVTCLLKSLQKSYSVTYHIFIEFLLGVRQHFRHLRQIKEQGRQNHFPYGGATACK